MYKEAKREAKRVVLEAKNKAYENMYRRLETKEGEHDLFKLAKARARRSRDLDTIKFIKDDDGRVLVRKEDIKVRWRNYFHKLFNGTRERHEVTENFCAAQGQRNYCFCRKITKEEVKRALRKMGRAKAVGPDHIPFEVWKCLGEEGAQWLADLFNVIFKTARMQRSGGAVL